MRNELMRLAAMLVCIIALASCDDDDEQVIRDFNLAEKMEARLDYAENFSIPSGNGDYAVSVANEEVVRVSAVGPSQSMKFGGLSITGLKKGTTTVSVTDKKTGTTKTMEVKVVNDYVAMDITESNDPIFPKGTSLFFVKDEHQSLFAFTNVMLEGLGTRAVLRGTGYYKWPDFNSTDESEKLLTINYTAQGSDPLDCGEVYEFDINGSQSHVIEYLKWMFANGQEDGMDAKATRTSAITPLDLEMAAKYGDYNMTGTFNFTERIPAGYLE